MRIPYYVIYDPDDWLGGGSLRVMELQRRRYRAVEANWMEEVGLALTEWQGVYEGAEESWLRWCNREGQLILTGRERAEQERHRAEQQDERAKRLEAQLRALGIEPSA